jgi:hypothetical protein
MSYRYYEGTKARARKKILITGETDLVQTRGIRKTAQPMVEQLNEALLLAYLNSRPESKEMRGLVRQIEASRKRSQKTQKETAKLRERNQAMLAKL